MNELNAEQMQVMIDAKALIEQVLPSAPLGRPADVGPPRPLPPQFFNVAHLPALFAALAAAQAEYGPVVRDKLVKMKLKEDRGDIRFYYADLAALLAATVPALTKHGLTFLQPLDQSGDEVWLNNILAHKDGGMIITRMLIPGANDIKAFGAQITFLRRYCAGPALGVSSEDDSEEDGTEAGDGDGPFPPQASQRRTIPADQPEAREQPQRRSATSDDEKPVSAGQLKNLKDKISAAGLIPDVVLAMCTRLGVKHGITEKMTVAEWKLVRADIDTVV